MIELEWSIFLQSTPVLTAGGKFIHNMTESPDKQVSHLLCLHIGRFM